MSRMITAADFQAARVTNPSQAEIIRQTLYDSHLYPAAGTQSLNFFQSPVGQGVTTALGAVATTPKTKFDTNMQLGGQLPSGIQFLAESIELLFYPGSVSTANTFTVDTLTFFLAAASAVPTAQVDDVSAFYQSGLLELTVLNKVYLSEQPLVRFPPKTQLNVAGAIASNSATTAEVGFARAFAEGRPYYLEPPILLQPAMSWGISCSWPGLVPMTSGFNARVVCVVDGAMMRASQ